MSIFRDFFVKEKPVFTGITRGLGGFGFGAAAAGSSGPTAITGGTQIIDGSYTYHVFLSPDTFSSGTPIAVNYLVVGGGGAQAGGAGGFRNNTTTLVDSSYVITVGEGGDSAPAGTPTAPGAYNGGDSSIAGVAVATGGGAGGGRYPIGAEVGQPGGSGGGGTNPSAVGNTVASPDGISPTVQGSPGGSGVAGPRIGGGGGAGGPGTNASPGPSPQSSGDGGPGLPASWVPAPIIAPAIPAPIEPAWTSAVGPTGLFAGGGAGGTEGGTGGPGGGGSGVSNAVDYTGGGGGATANGGNGIVIIRYLTP